MTLSSLKTVCAAYLGRSVADLTIDSVDMFLVAANNVRKNAELLHDFESARVSATLSIDSVEGGALDSAVIAGNESSSSEEEGSVTVSGAGLTPDLTGTFTYGGVVNGQDFYLLTKSGTTYILYRDDSTSWTITELHSALNVDAGQFLSATLEGDYIAVPPFDGSPVAVLNAGGEVVPAPFSGLKSVTNIQRARSDGSYIPLDFTRADIAVERERTELEFSDDYYPEIRYPSDSEFLTRGSTSAIVQRGGRLYIYPHGTGTSTPLDVVLEGYAFLRDYTAADLASAYEGDFFLQHGSRFLQWAIICELNYIFQRFVPRQEGVLSPPEQAREAAWRDLLLWDSYLIDPNSNVSR